MRQNKARCDSGSVGCAPNFDSILPPKKGAESSYFFSKLCIACEQNALRISTIYININGSVIVNSLPFLQQ